MPTATQETSEQRTAQPDVATTALFGHFAARFFDAPVPGQIGPQDRNYVIYAKSLAAAKRAAKALQQERGHIRLVEVFAIPEDERAEFRRNGWYVAECWPNAAGELQPPPNNQK